MDEPQGPVPLQAGQGELIIAHPEVEGAVMRIPSSSFDPKVHKEWDLSVPPWRDGAGNLLPGAEPPGAEPAAVEVAAPKPRKPRRSEPDAE